MAKIAQFRYYGESNENNYTSIKDGEIPSKNNLKMPSKDNLKIEASNLFTGCYPIVQLGIQTLPGAEIYINGCDFPMIIGSTGILDLELDTTVQITSLAFSEQTLDRIDSTVGGYILIDILYEGGAV